MRSNRRKLAGLVWIIMGPIMMVTGVRDRQWEARLAASGIKAYARILHVEESYGSRGGANTLHLSLLFHTDQPTPTDYQAEAQVRSSELPADQYNSLKTSETVLISYLPDDPTRVEVNGAPKNTTWTISIGAIFTILAVGFLLWR